MFQLIINMDIQTGFGCEFIKSPNLSVVGLGSGSIFCALKRHLDFRDLYGCAISFVKILNWNSNCDLHQLDSFNFSLNIKRQK